ncbi:alkaline phosphatase family protein [Halococcus sediminicola]|uniref:hypothetical protein n=1 Tax=Halococcus sediminicola TaxID=1264579 RepID=UPI000679827E|nr:hypothetical protein [Halococcus sediminicola]
MTFADWLAETKARVDRDGMAGVRTSADELWIGALRRADRFADPGVNIYDRSWDALVILDGCRADVLRGVAHGYEFLDDPGTHRSPGSTSYEWMERTFTDEYADEIANTVHVSANPFTHQFLDADRFALLDEVWRDAWDEEVGIVPARPVTDRAIRAGRERGSDERLLVHYMQPHFPSVPRPLGGSATLDEWRDGREMAWQGLRRGEFTEREVWGAYVANLRYVLDDLEILLDNLDAERVAITADHGNAKGEWGIYGHPNVPLDVLRTVPWFVTSATDRRTHEPEIESGKRSDPTDETVAERLQALGYTEDETG